MMMRPFEYQSNFPERFKEAQDDPRVQALMQQMNPVSPLDQFGKNLGMAPLTIMGDIAGSLKEHALNIPEYWEKGKTEVPALINQMSGRSVNPVHNLGQDLAGFLEGLNSVGQFPANFAEYSANRLNVIPEILAQAVKDVSRPYDISPYIKYLGEPKYPGEALGREISKIGANELLGIFSPSFHRLKRVDQAKEVQEYIDSGERLKREREKEEQRKSIIHNMFMAGRA